VADDVRALPAERVEDAAGISDIHRHGVRPVCRRRLETSLLVPRDVVLLRELVREITQVAEAEPRPPMQQENLRPAPGAATGDQRPVVVGRERSPRHRRRSSHAADSLASRLRELRTRHRCSVAAARLALVE
jgi:hypothetical protein